MNLLDSSPLRILALTGFMGAGKTTVGRLLAAERDWGFVDVDAQIVSTTGHSIAELFAQHGEAWFRDLEHRTICDLAFADASSGALVLALGGGAIEHEQTRLLLTETPGIALVHLQVSLPEAIRRCTADRSVQRPVLADRQRLAERYALRLPLYLQAHCTVPVDGHSPQEILAQIQNRIPAQSHPDYPTHFPS